MKSGAKTLWSLAVKSQGQIEGLSENLDSKYQQRLLDLGIMPGEEIMCLRTTPFNGPRVYQMRHTVLSFDREICESIFIKDSNG